MSTFFKLVCPQTREEAMHILYARNKLIIHLVGPIDYSKGSCKSRIPLKDFPSSILQQFRHANTTTSSFWTADWAKQDRGSEGRAGIVIRQDNVGIFGGVWKSYLTYSTRCGL